MKGVSSGGWRAGPFAEDRGPGSGGAWDHGGSRSPGTGGAVQLSLGPQPHTSVIFFGPGGDWLDCPWGLGRFLAGALGRQERGRFKEDGERP